MKYIHMGRLVYWIDQLNEKIGYFTSWLTAALVALVCLEVGIGFFNTSWTWLTELEWHLFSLIFLLGAGYAFKHDKHVRVDLFYTHFSPKDKALVNLIGNLILLIPWCIVIIWAAVRYAYIAFKIGENSPDPGGLPARFVIKAMIGLGFFLLLLQGIAETAKAWQTYQGSNSSAE